MKIDSHHHFWSYNEADFDWIPDHMASIRRDFYPSDLLSEIQGAGVDGVLSVQANQTLEENRFLLKHAEDHDFILGVVGWLPLADPDVEKHIEAFAAHPKAVGVRHIVQAEPDEGFLLGVQFNRGVSLVHDAGLSYDILILEHQLPSAIQFADMNDGDPLILDHIGKPRIAAAEMEPWKTNMRELAKRDNVFCKLSGVVTEADPDQWTADCLKPYIEEVIEAFGPQRLMFGSDWPVVLPGMPYGQWLTMVEQCIESWSETEKEAFWSGNATRAYGL